MSITSLDLADWLTQQLGQHESGNTLVYLRLDVEGSEYDLLPYLLMRSALCPVHFMQVEWHLKFVTPESHLAAVSLRLSLSELLQRGRPPLPFPRWVAAR